ncbi:DUF2493 domain-containing protein [Streptomyces sp. NRRL F-5123]|uniref:DUF2493 domain-containing protein n=1 Tax=Streptomyces sp. NRRL F-5123 TaxID=1463856 RepID=UPI0004E113FE|nr:DUF2493 domain-containing protein [Streptomyces sp. NRRL F-5123]
MSTPTYRVLVTGSRDWHQPVSIEIALTSLLLTRRHITVVHGACPRGADAMAHAWATTRGIEVEPHPADWQQHGKAAGFRRNAEMVNLGADLCLAFIRNSSRGASHTAALADAAGIPVRRWTA